MNSSDSSTGSMKPNGETPKKAHNCDIIDDDLFGDTIDELAILFIYSKSFIFK